MFRKSTRSGPWTDNCVEVDLDWHKSTASGYNGGCVEVNCQCEVDQILVRDSKDRGGPVLAFTAVEWDAFIAGVKAGEFDRHPS